MDNPKFNDGWCDSECPFLEDRGKNQYDLNFYCKKYNIGLDYYDWVLRTEKCYEQKI